MVDLRSPFYGGASASRIQNRGSSIESPTMTAILSMTGKAAARSEGGVEADAEVRSVNGRSFKLVLKAPDSFAPFEEEVRAIVRRRVERGTVNVSLWLRSPSEGPEVRICDAAVETYGRALRDLSQRLGLDTQPDPALILGLPGAAEIVETRREASAEEKDCLLRALSLALEKHGESRRREGEVLAEDLRARAKEIRACVEKIRVRAPVVVEEYRQRLAARLRELLAGQDAGDSEAYRSEVAVFAERSDIHEECVRGLSHLDAFDKTLAGGGEAGRRLEFIAQELHRELNTINSKANDFEIASQAVAAKTAIDQIKEQVQNVE
jgi:uncharacterized protein (TIGR00255 family)